MGTFVRLIDSGMRRNTSPTTKRRVRIPMRTDNKKLIDNGMRRNASPTIELNRFNI